MSEPTVQALHARVQALEAELSALRARQPVADAALALAQQRYQFLFDTMDEGFCIIEFFDGPHGPLSDYVHVQANPAYAKHAGIENVVGQKLREMVPAEADQWVARYGHVLHSGEPVRFEQELIATGRYLDVTAFRMEPAARNQVAVLFQDVTPRKAAEKALRELNEHLETRVRDALEARRVLAEVVDGSRAMIHVLAPDYRWLAINGSAVRSFEQFYGVRPRVGDNLLQAMDAEPERQARVRELWARAFAGEEFSEVVALGTAQLPRHFDMQFTPLRAPDGALIGAYQFVYDVSDRVREQARLRLAEDALRQSQRMEAVGQLTGGIAHDFNNLLTGIAGSLELLQTRLAQGRVNELDRYVSAAQSASRRAAALTHRLLAFSRRQTLDPKPTDVNRLVKHMEDLVRRSIGPQMLLEVVTAAGLWPTLIDPPQLENALLNLCLNARDAMPGGGRITLETANRWIDERLARERDMPPGQYISLCVTDTGCGMSEDVIARAFEPFFTTKPLGEGTGLGLSMVYGFVRQSGGQVRIYSEVGHGSTLCIYLPRYYGEAAHEADSAPTSTPARADGSRSILVVDDEPAVRMLVVEVLEDLGYHTLEAADGATGLALLQGPLNIDLLVSDVGLPGGLNGRQLADAARALRPALPVLFITGYAENSVIGNGHLAPGMRVLTKPFNLETLVERVQQMLEAST
ncbi:PAS domain-containing protein [Pseudomonas sp. NPDC007930]|uniref:PAS domain-containing protein n=1 Tax=Pseudomonas sp. NPDC007930 TaxID=3364417 RepID=UPI0036F1939A